MASDSANDFAHSPKAEVVCFGMVVPATLLIVDEFPSLNTGAVWKHVSQFISDDAVIVAMLLQKWGVQAGLICTALGDDEAGRNTADSSERRVFWASFASCKTLLRLTS